MRELTSHKVNGLNEALTIKATDEPGQGNACHEYEVSLQKDDTTRKEWLISFQNGPIAEAGLNGISGEALLAIVEDRLIGFQSGPFACRENAVALTKLQECMMWLQKRTRELQKRTRDRVGRGVEVTNAK